MTNEQPFVHQALHRKHVDITTQALLDDFDGHTATLKNIFTGEPELLEVKSVVIVGHRLPCDELYQSVNARQAEFQDAGIKSMERIGDALAAGALVHAVYSGHAFARQLDQVDDGLYLRDIPVAEHPPGPVIR